MLAVASATDRGRVRSQNEDSLIVDARLGYAVLADGMGGYNAGEVASRIAVSTVDAEMRNLGCEGLDAMTDERLAAAVSAAVAAANTAICSAAQEHAACAGMGTTIVMAVWRGASLVTAHAGDSRLYRYRDAVLEQLTRDHSYVQEQVDLGLLTREQARRSPGRSLVTRALGMGAQVEIEAGIHRSRPGDLYLLCSDGLSDMLDDAAMTCALDEGAQDLDRMAQALMRHANENGGRDNISVILVKVLAQDRT